MGLIASLRKGLGYVLLAMGASSSAALGKKPTPGATAKNGPPRPPQKPA